MHSLVLRMPYAPIFWVAYVWAFLPERRIIRAARRSDVSRGRQDAGSLRVIVTAGWVGIFAAFLLAWRAPGWSFGPVGAATGFWLGLAMLVGGSLLRRHCFRVLGEWFTGVVMVRATQPVVEVGAYRWVRHPSYTAGALMWIGIGLALANWASVAALAVTTVLAYGYRVRVEERALVETIGAPYREYMARTRRFVPRLF